MNYFIFKQNCFYCWAGPQVGPGRFQAGRVPEEAGLRAGPGRCQAGHRPESAGLMAGPGRGQGRGGGVRGGDEARWPAMIDSERGGGGAGEA